MICQPLKTAFGSFSNTRKNRNITKNNKVSFVVGWDDEEDITVQYEGIARKLEGGAKDEAREIHIKKNSASSKYSFDPLQEFFKVSPIWIRYSDLSKDPPETLEVKF